LTADYRCNWNPMSIPVRLDPYNLLHVSRIPGRSWNGINDTQGIRRKSGHPERSPTHLRNLRIPATTRKLCLMESSSLCTPTRVDPTAGTFIPAYPNAMDV